MCDFEKGFTKVSNPLRKNLKLSITMFVNNSSRELHVIFFIPPKKSFYRIKICWNENIKLKMSAENEIQISVVKSVISEMTTSFTSMALVIAPFI